MKELLFVALTILMLVVWFKYFLYPFLKDDRRKHKIFQFNEEERYTAAKRLIDDYWKSYVKNHRPIWGHPIDREMIGHVIDRTGTYSQSIETLSKSVVFEEKVKRLETKDPEQLDIVVDCPYFYATERITYIKPDCPEWAQKTILEVHDQTLGLTPERRRVFFEDLADALSATDVQKEQWAIGDDGELVRK